MLKHVKSSVFLALIMLLVLAFPTATWAHSKLETSTPAADAKLTENVKEVSLSFNENIDENLSTIKIKNEQGEAVEVSEVNVTENNMVGTLAAPLPTGSYTVEWKIVGGDGHPVDGTYNFEVDAPEAETVPETPAETPADNEETPADTGNAQEETAPADDNTADNTDQKTDQNQQEEKSSTNEESPGSGTIVWIIIIVVVAFVASYFGIKASRKKK
ncbi:copper resistance protein CopC [Paenibacillus solani]|uniref:copper resistance CopC family protein n=1 Tax=Paenibacillus solani TaxID=1705565 RepID=UPI003D2675A1